MSFEDTKCPCGGKKECHTLICETCRDHISANNGEFELKNVFESERFDTNVRRGMAIRIVTAARKRTSRRELAMTYKY